MTRKYKVRDLERARKELNELLDKIEYLVPIVVVEGPRDAEALRQIGFKGRIELFSRVNLSESDFIDFMATVAASVVILTDFDSEGRRINRNLIRLFERRGVRVEVGLRRAFGRLMAELGIHTIEALDDVVSVL
jgi:5S rRNA maturation endonuclease (ribonuclease M5)